MTYDQVFEKVKALFQDADVSGIQEHLAYQFNITGEGAGAFYVEVSGGQLSIQPYEYHDRDACFTCSADTLLNIASGKAIGACRGCLFGHKDAPPFKNCFYSMVKKQPYRKIRAAVAAGYRPVRLLKFCLDGSSHLPRTPDDGDITGRSRQSCHNSAAPFYSCAAGFPPSLWRAVRKYL